MGRKASCVIASGLGGLSAPDPWSWPLGSRLPVTEYPLHFLEGHLFVETGDKLWLLDTGAPSSFGSEAAIELAGVEFNPASVYMGLTAERLSSHVGILCAGLLGADVLGQFDLIIDVPGNKVLVSTESLAHEGTAVPFDSFMGIPIVDVQIGENEHRMFFDTGAQFSYLLDGSLMTFARIRTVQDFYPGMGEFETDIYDVPIRLGDRDFGLQCGRLPEPLGASLMMANARGIVGNEILVTRSLGYFPRRQELSL